MGRIESQEADSKSHLVKQICDISNKAVFCSQWHHHHNTINSHPFIDWYLLLQVEENVGADIIRKKYHKYALQLHPDKNKQPKAEFAFKLVSEAYSCLSDEKRRAAFDIERWKNRCSECIAAQEKGGSSTSERLRSKKILGRVKEIKARFKEEARVIESCLEANATKMEYPTFKSANVFEKEIPVFNPNEYLSQGYPHFRAKGCNKPERLWSLHKGYKYEHQQQANRKCDLPVFECKSTRSSFKLKSACIYS